MIVKLLSLIIFLFFYDDTRTELAKSDAYKYREIQSNQNICL